MTFVTWCMLFLFLVIEFIGVALVNKHVLFLLCGTPALPLSPTIANYFSID